MTKDWYGRGWNPKIKLNSENHIKPNNGIHEYRRNKWNKEFQGKMKG